MANYNVLKTAIQNAIKANGNNAITGPVLQSELISMVNVLGAGYQYFGVAQPSTNPGNPDSKCFFVAYTPGTYVNFDGIVVTGLCILKYDTVWRKEDINISGGSGSVVTFNSLSNGTTQILVDGVPQAVIPSEYTLLKLSAFTTTPSGLADGSFYYNTSDKKIYQKRDPTVAVIPYYDGAIYTYNNALYVWNGTDLVNVGGGGGADFLTEPDDLALVPAAQQGDPSVLKFANRSYNSQSPTGMGYKILRKDSTFAEQVTEANTIYEIRYDFTLSADVTIPANCVLFFNGGSVSGAALTCNGTLLLGAVKCEEIKGTIANDSVQTSWFSASNFANIAKAVFDSGATLYVDKNIAMDGTAKSVAQIRIDGNGKTITNPCYFTVTGDIVSIKNVAISNISFAGDFISISGTTRARLELKKISFDGGMSCRRFFDWYDTSQSTYLEFDVCGCTFKNVMEGFLFTSGDSTGKISDNLFDGIGDASDNTNLTQIGMRIGRQYQGNGFAQNLFVCNNVFKNIKAPYLTGEDAKETHAILIYGYNCTVDGNTVYEIASNQTNKDPGAETEAIYLKGSFHKITNNTVINGSGTHSDGCITVKGLSDIAENNRHFNIIAGNTIILTNGYGHGITFYCVKSTIDDNVIDVGDSSGFAIMFLISTNSKISNNKIYSVRANGENVARMTAFAADNGCDDLHFCNNIVEAATILTTSVNAGTFYFHNNYIVAKDTQYGTSSSYQSFINKSSGNPSYVFRGNRIVVDSCRANAFIANVSNLHFEDNYFKFIISDGSPVSPYFAGIFRYVTNVTFIDNIIDISGYSAVQFVYQANEGATVISENTKFLGTTKMSTGPSVISRNATILGQNNCGTTAERQAVRLYYNASMLGYQFFDTDLNKVCFAKAINYNTGVVSWVDATGTDIQ